MPISTPSATMTTGRMGNHALQYGYMLAPEGIKPKKKRPKTKVVTEGPKKKTKTAPGYFVNNSTKRSLKNRDA